MRNLLVGVVAFGLMLNAAHAEIYVDDQLGAEALGQTMDNVIYGVALDDDSNKIDSWSGVDLGGGWVLTDKVKAFSYSFSLYGFGDSLSNLQYSLVDHYYDLGDVALLKLYGPVPGTANPVSFFTGAPPIGTQVQVGAHGWGGPISDAGSDLVLTDSLTAAHGSFTGISGGVGQFIADANDPLAGLPGNFAIGAGVYADGKLWGLFSGLDGFGESAVANFTPLTDDLVGQINRIMQPVPEPASITLLGMGLAGLLYRKRSRKG